MAYFPCNKYYDKATDIDGLVNVRKIYSYNIGTIDTPTGYSFLAFYPVDGMTSVTIDTTSIGLHYVFDSDGKLMVSPYSTAKQATYTFKENTDSNVENSGVIRVFHNGMAATFNGKVIYQ